MANGPVSLSPEQRKKILMERKGKSRNMGGSEKDERPNDWVKDLGGVIKSGGKNIGKAADAASDVLIDKDAWKALAPGGKKATLSDVANVALDASMLIPGVGLAGGAARVGARLGARALAKEGARVAERQLSPLAERAVARQAAGAGRRKAGAAAASEAAPAAERAAAGAAKHRAATGGARKAEGAGRAKAERLTEDLAKWGETGGKRIGRSQSKRMLALTGGATVGANLATRAYDEAGKPKPPPKGELAPVAPADGGQPYYLIGSAAYPLPTDSGGGFQIPNSVQRALADYRDKGGAPDGAQVVYLGR